MDYRHSEPEHRPQEQDQFRSREREEIQIELETVDDLIRYDRDQTKLPERLKERLEDSIPKQRTERKPWWQRWFGPQAGEGN